MLKIINFYKFAAEPNEGIQAAEKAQTIRTLRVDEVDEDEARAVLRAVANGMYGPELERWKFLPDTADSASIAYSVAVHETDTEAIDIEVRHIPTRDNEPHSWLALKVVGQEVIHIELK